jgi:methionyl-tRNA formyltransferase
LARLVAAGHVISLVLTQPDRPAGRGLHPTPSPVKRFAESQGLEVLQPASLKAEAPVERVLAARPDALVVAAYGLILPRSLLDAAPYGAINIHASLLPRWRGAAPIQRALLAGDAETGISIMQMDAGLDTGPVLLQRATPIARDDDAGTLHDKLAELGAQMIVETLSLLQDGRVQAGPQAQSGVTYARKLDKRESVLDWSRPAVELERAVRAFRPAPGASTLLGGEPIKIWRVRVAHAALAPGSLLQAGNELLVGCGEGALALDELQRAGGRKLGAAEFLRGRPLPSDARFG